MSGSTISPYGGHMEKTRRRRRRRRTRSSIVEGFKERKKEIRRRDEGAKGVFGIKRL